MSNKIFRILELIWLSMGCIGVLLCSYFIIIKDTQGALFFLIFTFASGLMYAVRKRQRKKFEAALKEKEQKK